MTLEALSEWSNASTEDLKSLGHYGSPRWSSLSASIPLGQDMDLGTDWDMFESASIVETLITNWAEQEADEHAFWLPVLFYHLLLSEDKFYAYDTQTFAKFFLKGLTQTSEAIERNFGSGYAQLLGRAGGQIANQLSGTRGARDLAVCADAFRITI